MSKDCYKQCGDCYHKDEKSPCACDSCEQPVPTNYGEVPPPAWSDRGRELLDEFLLNCADISQEEREAVMEFIGGR